ncbi:MAG: enoyl-CoA hydratase-related protein [Woeseiaceae bacterium]
MQTLRTELQQGWLTIFLSQPDKRNALTDKMVAELSLELTRTAADASIRGITMRGDGAVFCAGGDLKGFQSNLDADSRALIDTSSRTAGNLFHQIDEMPQVVFMRVHGAAIAGGLGVVCGGDVVAVTADAKFALTETQLGIVPAQIAPLVVQRVGAATARRLMLTGARFDGTTAAKLGLADFVANDEAALDEIEAQVRRDVMRCAPGAIAATKQLIRDIQPLNTEETIEYAAMTFTERLASDEGREGIASFIEKRKPEWSA